MATFTVRTPQGVNMDAPFLNLAFGNDIGNSTYFGWGILEGAFEGWVLFGGFDFVPLPPGSTTRVGTVTDFRAVGGEPWQTYFDVTGLSTPMERIYAVLQVPGALDWDQPFRDVVYAGDDQFVGSAGADTLRANAGNDYVSGGAGADDLNGNAGNDTVEGGLGDDVLRGGQGDDSVHGNAGVDTVWGDLGQDTIRGGQGSDLIVGGEGADRLYGDLGSDTLTGGSGADRFIVFLEPDNDVIADFRRSEGDQILVNADADVRAEQAGDDVRLMLGWGGHWNEVRLIGVQLSGLTGDWWRIGPD